MGLCDKFVDRFQDIPKGKNPAVSKANSSNYLELSKENVSMEYDAVTLIMLYLKVLHDMVSQMF